MKRPSARPQASAFPARPRWAAASPGPPDDSDQVSARRTRDDWQWLLVAIAVPVVLLASRLNLDFWYDEVYTLYEFAARPAREIVSDYSAPNNHILYTLLLRPFFLLSKAEIALRFPSFVLAIATLVALYELGRRLAGREVAALAVLALGLNQMYLTHAVQLRGYGLSMLLVTLLAQRAVAAAQAAASGRRPGWSAAAAIALFSAAFLYTIPTNSLFLAPLGLWGVAAVWRAAKDWRSAMVAARGWIAGWLLAAGLYLPVVNQLRAAASAQPRAPLDAALTLGANVFWAAGHDAWPLWLVLPLGLVGWWRRRPISFGAQRLASLVLVMCLAPLVLVGLAGGTPFVRTFCPLLPFLALGTGWLLAGLIALVEQAFATRFDPAARRLVGLLASLVVLLPALVSYPARLRAYRAQNFAQDGYYNYYAADFQPSAAARFLQSAVKTNQNYLVCYDVADHFNLVHYLTRAGFPFPPRRLEPDVAGKIWAEVYIVAAPLTKFDALARQCGLPPRVLSSFPLVYEGDYFRIFRSPAPLDLPVAKGA